MIEALIPNGFTIFVVALVIVAIVFIWGGVKQIPYGQEWKVERFGTFNRTMQPGLNLIIPFVEKVVSKRSTFDGRRDHASPDHQDDEKLL